MSELAALVLAGGRATRLGGIDKTALQLDGTTLLARAVTAARRGGADPVVVVGPQRPGVHATWVREEPRFGGPAAAVAAGLSRAVGERVLVLGADLLRPGDVVTALLAADPGSDGTDGIVLVDSAGRTQWLCGIYRRAALGDAVAALGDPVGASLGRMLSRLRLARHPIADTVVADVDSPADARAAGITL